MKLTLWLLVPVALAALAEFFITAVMLVGLGGLLTSNGVEDGKD